MKSEAQQNVEAARAMPKKLRDEAAAVWDRAYTEMVIRLEALPVRKCPKVYEVHHAVENARAAFVKSLVAGRPLNECRAAALLAFPSVAQWKNGGGSL